LGLRGGVAGGGGDFGGELLGGDFAGRALEAFNARGTFWAFDREWFNNRYRCGFAQCYPCALTLGRVVGKLGIKKSIIRTAPTADEVQRIENRVEKNLVGVARMSGTKLVEQLIQVELAHAFVP